MESRLRSGAGGPEPLPLRRRVGFDAEVLITETRQCTAGSPPNGLFIRAYPPL